MNWLICRYCMGVIPPLAEDALELQKCKCVVTPGMPDTRCWMSLHIPEGYEIVRLEIVPKAEPETPT